jgi:pyruvate/2-oxoglutarate/acetoin dehydrogenase E1 component
LPDPAAAAAKGLVKTAIRSKNPCFVLEGQSITSNLMKSDSLSH